MNQAIKDAIAVSNEAIRILLELDGTSTSLGPRRDELIDAAMGEIEDAMDCLKILKRQNKED